MSRILIEYQPFGLSTISKVLIRSCITPSMISTMEAVEETTSHYDIDSIIRLLEENEKVLKSDLKIINKLRKEGVAYIEI